MVDLGADPIRATDLDGRERRGARRDELSAPGDGSPFGPAPATDDIRPPHDHGGPDWWDDLSVRPEAAASEAWPAIGVVAALTASNVMTNRVLPRWAYVPWNVGVATALVWWARTVGGCSTAELGISRRHLWGGLRWGGAAAGIVVTGYALGATAPATRPLFRDDRAERCSPAELAWRVLIEIPFGTALAEEVAFRGVLPAMFRRRFAAEEHWAVRADVSAAGLFGLWHVLPAFGLAEANPTLQSMSDTTGAAAAIAGSVASTTAAGLLFTWLRNRSGSVAAPVLLHGAINGGAFTVSWLLGHERRTERPSWSWRRPVRRRVGRFPFRRRPTGG